MIKTSYKVFFLLCIAAASILIRDFTLYPSYSWSDGVFTAMIRLAVLFFTVYLSYLFRPGMWKRKGLAILHVFLWISIIPHSFYNITQVRHVSEMCRLSQGNFFAGSCDDLLWTILPLLVYGIGSLVVFFYSVDRLASLIKGSYKYLFLLSVFGYAALGAVIGIYSRIDTIFSLFLDMHANLMLLGSIMKLSDFWFNVFAYFVFANIVYFSAKASFDLMKPRAGE